MTARSNAFAATDHAAGDAPADPRSDAQLVDAINRGDEQAFEALYRRHRDWVARIAYRATGDRELALDTVQETFIDLLHRFPGFELRARMTTFLYPIVTHKARQAARKTRRENVTDNAPEQTNPNQRTPDTPAERREALDALLADLPDAQREVLLMRYVDQMSQDEIAEALDIPPGTVKSRLHHALRRLREDPRTKDFFFG